MDQKLKSLISMIRILFLNDKQFLPTFITKIYFEIKNVFRGQREKMRE